MIARLLISQGLENRIGEINKILKEANLTNPHPDLLYFLADARLGILEARKIKEHFSLKPYSAKGRVVIMEDASKLTTEAQNALLKILEEPPEESLIILGGASDAKFLPTVLSRCQIINLGSEKYNSYKNYNNYTKDLGDLLKANVEDRFEYIEKLKDKTEFLQSLIKYFHQNLPEDAKFTKELLQAEEWAGQNVNIRAILEYLMLVMPTKPC